MPGDVTSGPGWSWRNGAVFATSGALLDGLDIAGMVDVNGTNVTVRNSRITTRSFANLLVREGSANVTVTDTEISDVEDELNGLLTYDREVLKVDEDVVRAALDALRRRG